MNDDYHPHYPDAQKDYFLRLMHLANLLQLAANAGISYPTMTQLNELAKKHNREWKGRTIAV